MAYFNINKLPEKERIALIGEFYALTGTVKNRDEAAKIFRDLLDGNEIGNIMRRIDIAILLKLGFSYEEIIELLGVGRDKISRVQRKLDRGGQGYQLLIERALELRTQRKIKVEKQKIKRSRKQNSPEVESIKKRYPTAFLLWNIIDEFGDRFEAKSQIGNPQEQAKEYYQTRKGKK